MKPEYLDIEITCAVCKSAVRYPHQAACPHCKWPVLLYTGRPDAEHLQQLDRLLNTHRQAFEQLKKNGEELNRLEAEYKKKEEHTWQQRTQLQAITDTLKSLGRKKEALLANPLLSIDLAALQKKAADLERHLIGQRPKIAAIENNTPAPLTLRCTYESSTNEIKAVATRLLHAKPVTIEPLFGLAVADRAFTHFSEADMIIPVKNQHMLPLKVIEIDQEIRIPLAHKPGEAMAHNQIIHLYHHTISKFIIE